MFSRSWGLAPPPVCSYGTPGLRVCSFSAREQCGYEGTSGLRVHGLKTHQRDVDASAQTRKVSGLDAVARPNLATKLARGSAMEDLDGYWPKADRGRKTRTVV